MTSGSLGSSFSTGGTGPGADGLTRGCCGEAGRTQCNLGRKMVKRESLNGGGRSSQVMGPGLVWDPRAVSCDRCWATLQKAGRRTWKNLKIRLWMLSQKEEGRTSPGMEPPARRAALSHSLPPTALPRHGAPWGCCTHQPQPRRLTKRTAAAHGRRASLKSGPWHGLGWLPYHGGLLSPGISWGAAESSASHLALQNEAILSPVLGSITPRPVPWS